MTNQAGARFYIPLNTKHVISGCSSQPISWLATDKTKPNKTNNITSTCSKLTEKLTQIATRPKQQYWTVEGVAFSPVERTWGSSLAVGSVAVPRPDGCSSVRPVKMPCTAESCWSPWTRPQSTPTTTDASHNCRQVERVLWRSPCTVMRKGKELNKNIGSKSLQHFVQRLFVPSVRQQVTKPQRKILRVSWTAKKTNEWALNKLE